MNWVGKTARERRRGGGIQPTSEIFRLPSTSPQWKYIREDGDIGWEYVHKCPYLHLSLILLKRCLSCCLLFPKPRNVILVFSNLSDWASQRRRNSQTRDVVLMQMGNESGSQEPKRLASNTKLRKHWDTWDIKSLAHMPSPEGLIFNVAKHAVMAWVLGIYCHFWLDCSASLNDKADFKCLKPPANISFFLSLWFH